MENIDRQRVKTDEDFRFLLACQLIINDNKAKSERQLSLKLTGDKNAALINKIKEGIQSAQKENIDILTTEYGVRKEYIYVGTGPVYSTSKEETKKPDVVSQAEFDKVVEENKKLKEEVLELTRRVLRLLDNKEGL